MLAKIRARITAKAILIKLFGYSPAIDPVTPLTTTY
jgi:hypothetical protein